MSCFPNRNPTLYNILFILKSWPKWRHLGSDSHQPFSTPKANGILGGECQPLGVLFSCPSWAFHSLTPPPEGGQEKGKRAKFKSCGYFLTTLVRFGETGLGIIITEKRFEINCGFHNWYLDSFLYPKYRR